MHDRRLRAHKWIQGSTQNDDDDESTNGDAARQNLHPPDWRASSDASRPSANRAPLCERRLCLQAPLCPQRHQSRLSTLRVQSDSGNCCDVGASASHGSMNGDRSTAAAAKRQLQRRHSDEPKESGDDDNLAGTLASFVRSTTFHGFDQLVHTEGWWARAFWVLTMCTVFVIVFVQLNTLVMYFVHNPTLTSIRLVYPERAHAHRSGAPPWGSPEGSDGDGDDQADLDEFDDDDDDDLDTDEARRRRLARKRAPVGPVGGMGFVYWYPNSHLLDTAYNSYDEHAVHVYMSPLDAMLEKNPTVLPVGYHAHIALRATKTIRQKMDHLGRAACTSPKLKYFDEYTYEACQVECLVDAVLERCNCTGVTSHGRIPQGRVCSPSMAIECYKQLALNFTQMLVRCRGDNCVEACEYWSYSSTLTVGRVFNPLLADKMTEYWRLPEVETFISALGGCMGLWTGASIVTWIHLAYWCCVRSCGTLKQRLNVFRQNQLTKLCLSPRPGTTLNESGSRAPIAQMDNGLQSPNVDTAAVSDTERTNNNTRPYRTDTQITGTGGGGESDTDTEWDAAAAAMSGLVGRRASYLAMVPRGSTEQPPDAQRRHGDGDATTTATAGKPAREEDREHVWKF